jgi:hypothetical protein
MRPKGLPSWRPPGDRDSIATDVGPQDAFGIAPPGGSVRLGAARRRTLLILRLVFGLLLAAGLVSFAIYVATGNPAWRQRGMVIVKWTVIAGLAAAAVLVLEELAVML